MSEYREKCLREKGRTCDVCGDSPDKIDVHHINGDRNNNNIDNLMPVCRSCHKDIHNGNNEEYYKKLLRIKSVYNADVEIEVSGDSLPDGVGSSADYTAEDHIKAEQVIVWVNEVDESSVSKVMVIAEDDDNETVYDAENISDEDG